MGGLARRVSYENALLKQVNGEVPVLQLDAGHMFSDDLARKGVSEDVRAKDEYILRAYERFRVAAANVSPRDLPYLTEMMSKGVHAENLKRFPMLGRIVSANAVPTSPDVLPFKPYVVEEVRGKRLGSKPLKVAVLGVTEKPAVPPNGGYAISDPVEAVKRLVPELRKKNDLVVVLAYVDRDTAKRIGLEAPGIDLIIAAHQFPLYNAVDEAGDAVVAMVSSQTKWLGEIRLYRSSDPKSGAISNYLHRDVPLDSSIPDDPEAAKVVAEAREHSAPKLPPQGAARPGGG
jgi:2',3'-cyclic-nucleotide 2'-phosphodiesterase (5'-nucleotidase family)